MKRTKLYLIGILSGLFIITSCNKDGDTNPQQNTNTPPSSFIRTYTGVLIGSTGAYELNLTENGAIASVVFDDETYNLYSNETLENGQSLTLNYGSISLTVEVDENGDNPGISFTIPGHNIQATIVLSNQTNPNRNYIGSTESVSLSEAKIYRTTFNLTLHDGNKWTGIERVDLDNDPGNPNHQSTQGQTTKVDGTYTENESSVILNRSNSIYTLYKVGDELKLYQAAGGTFEVMLTQVN